MDSDKKHIIQCDCQDEEESGVRVCVDQQQMVARTESRCGGCLLTSLFLFLLAIIGLTTIAVTAKIFLDVANTKFNVQLASSSSSDDVTPSDAEQNAIQDHVTEQAKLQILSTVLDYKKRLEVLEVQNELSGRVLCYVSPLMDGRLDDDMQRENTYTIPDTTTPFTTAQTAPARRTFHFVASDTPINDVTFLGQKAGEMCAGLETYWIIPTDPANTRDERVQQVSDDRIIVAHPTLPGVFNDVPGRQRREASQILQHMEQLGMLPINLTVSALSVGFHGLNRYNQPIRPRRP
jgi:hypothetical protein